MTTVHFITGTDTNVGKTVVTGWLALQALQSGNTVAVYKPVQTGSVDVLLPEDPCTIAAYLANHGFAAPPEQWLLAPQLNADQTLAIGYSYSFQPPVTPAVADVAGVIDLKTIITVITALANQVDVLLIEGAGGLLVPITPTLDTLGLIGAIRQNLPALTCMVVARPNLGTINHTRLTLSCLQPVCPVHGVIVSGYPKDSADIAIKTLPDMFAHWLPVPVTYLPYLDN
jgi:dethiobiotin synthetase